MREEKGNFLHTVSCSRPHGKEALWCSAGHLATRKHQPWTFPCYAGKDQSVMLGYQRGLSGTETPSSLLAFGKESFT